MCSVLFRETVQEYESVQSEMYFLTIVLKLRDQVTLKLTNYM